VDANLNTSINDWRDIVRVALEKEEKEEEMGRGADNPLSDVRGQLVGCARRSATELSSTYLDSCRNLQESFRPPTRQAMSGQNETGNDPSNNGSRRTSKATCVWDPTHDVVSQNGHGFVGGGKRRLTSDDQVIGIVFGHAVRSITFGCDFEFVRPLYGDF